MYIHQHSVFSYHFWKVFLTLTQLNLYENKMLELTDKSIKKAIHIFLSNINYGLSQFQTFYFFN